MLPKALELPLLIAASIFLCDQAAKFWTEQLLSTPIIISRLLRLSPLYNPGIFFGLFQTQYLKFFTILLSLVVVTITLDLLKKSRDRPVLLKTGVGLIWGGTLGNLTDRLLFGTVFDFIQLWWIPTFNLADTALTLGAIYVLVSEIKRCIRCF